MTQSPEVLFKEKILIITGDGVFGERLFKTVTEGGYRAFLVKNGVEGLKTIYDVLPHLILLDIVLPGADGYEILAQKTAEPMLSKIPVFLMSTQAVPINMRRVPEGSVAEFIMTLSEECNDIVKKIDRYFKNERKVNEKSKAGKEAKKVVFWVEDDKLIGSILEKKFISSGFDLIHAKSGSEAMNLLDNAAPDVIILDLMLPGMSGFEILQKIKSDQRFKNIPVMILSNLSKPSDIERAKILGVRKFIVKAAVSLDKIVSEVKALCTAK